LLAYVSQESILQPPVEGEIVKVLIACVRLELDLLCLVASVEQDSFARYAASENQRGVIDDTDVGFSDASLSG
jgi:hypothetical protein